MCLLCGLELTSVYIKWVNSGCKGVNSHILQVVLIHRYEPELFTKVRFFKQKLFLKNKHYENLHEKRVVIFLKLSPEI